MTAIADFALSDGLATPTNHTFKVKSIIGRTSTWEDRVTGIPVAYTRAVSETKENENVRRVKFKVTMPTLEAVSGSNASGFVPAAQLGYSHQATVEFILPQRGSKTERTTILSYMKGLLSNGQFAALVTDGDEFI